MSATKFIKSPKQRACKRCVMDTSHAEILFDSEGVCNFCHGFDLLNAARPRGESATDALTQCISSVKAAGASKKYDCVLGLSGGVDSSYLALKLKEWGLRPLAVQFDNGWNTELANHNIERICKALHIDLFTSVADWEEFSALQRSFLKAGVANAEAPTDHAIFATIYRTARKFRIPYLITGVNVATECYNPIGHQNLNDFSFGYYYSDLHHIKAIHRHFGGSRLRNFPSMGILEKIWYEKFRLTRLDPLNLIEYNKEEAARELQDRLGWRPYSGKHHESVFTRFHQSYILPRKFKLDKRKLHMSNLIWSGQLSRIDAIEELSKPACPEELIRQDEKYVKTKLGFSDKEWSEIINSSPVNFSAYPNQLWLIRAIQATTRRLALLRGRFRENT
jgi:N-acetyl sugar amidotransferase